MTSVAMIKALIWRGANNPEEQHLLESRAIRSLAVSEDGEEGVKSFFEKRKPKFTGTLSKDMPAWVPWVSHSLLKLINATLMHYLPSGTKSVLAPEMRNSEPVSSTKRSRNGIKLPCLKYCQSNTARNSAWIIRARNVIYNAF